MGRGVYSSPVIGTNGMIYAGSYNNYLYSIYPNGSENWKFYAGGDITGSPVIGHRIKKNTGNSFDEVIYIGSEDKNLYAIDPTKGKAKWTFPTGGEIISSPALNDKGIIYIATRNEKLHAVKTQSEDLADSPWPTLHNNNAHTSRTQYTVLDPSIYSVSPANMSIDVPINTSISVVFTKKMNIKDLTSDNFMVAKDIQSEIVEGKIETDGTTVTFIPDNLLEYDTKYVMIILNYVKDIDDKNLETGWESNFITQPKTPYEIETGGTSSAGNGCFINTVLK